MIDHHALCKLDNVKLTDVIDHINNDPKVKLSIFFYNDKIGYEKVLNEYLKDYSLIEDDFDVKKYNRDIFFKEISNNKIVYLDKLGFGKSHININLVEIARSLKFETKLVIISNIRYVKLSQMADIIVSLTSSDNVPLLLKFKNLDRFSANNFKF